METFTKAVGAIVAALIWLAIGALVSGALLWLAVKTIHEEWIHGVPVLPFWPAVVITLTVGALTKTNLKPDKD